MKLDARFHDGKVCQELREDYYATLKKNKLVKSLAGGDTKTITSQDNSILAGKSDQRSGISNPQAGQSTLDRNEALNSQDTNAECSAADQESTKGLSKKDENGASESSSILPAKRKSARLIKDQARLKAAGRQHESSTMTEETESFNASGTNTSRKNRLVEIDKSKEDAGKTKSSAQEDTYCEGPGSQTFSQTSVKSSGTKRKAQTPIKKHEKEQPQRKRDLKKNNKKASKAPIVKFTGAMKQPVKREQIIPDKPAKSLAAELESSSDTDSSSSESDSPVKEQKKKTKKTQKEKRSQSEEDSPDEEIKVDLKADKNRLSKPIDSSVSNQQEESDKYEETYRRDMFEKRLGLSNLGNSCYINCIVQILAHLVKFRELLDRNLDLADIAPIIKERSQTKSNEVAANSEATTSAPSSSPKNDNQAEKPADADEKTNDLCEEI